MDINSNHHLYSNLHPCLLPLFFFSFVILPSIFLVFSLLLSLHLFSCTYLPSFLPFTSSFLFSHLFFSFHLLLPLILSYLTLSYLSLLYLISSYLILFYLILHYLILSYLSFQYVGRTYSLVRNIRTFSILGCILRLQERSDRIPCHHFEYPPADPNTALVPPSSPHLPARYVRMYDK